MTVLAACCTCRKRFSCLWITITNGIGAGFVTYVAIKVARGRWREPGLLLWIIALAFVVYFAIDPVERLLGVK